MVCKKCEVKLGKVIVPDKWKQGARNTLESGGRKIGENRLLSKAGRASRMSPYSTKCIDCKQQVHQTGGQYCQHCAYKKGVWYLWLRRCYSSNDNSSLCGEKILDTSSYRMSAK